MTVFTAAASGTVHLVDYGTRTRCGRIIPVTWNRWRLAQASPDVRQRRVCTACR